MKTLRNLAFETEAYKVRRLQDGDGAASLSMWTVDPVAAEMLNTPVGLWPVDNQNRYFRACGQNESQILLGLFPKPVGAAIGLLILKPNPELGIFTLSAVIGLKAKRGKDTMAGVAKPLFRFLFGTCGFAKAKCYVRPQNKAMQWLLLTNGWKLEARMKSELLDVASGKRSDLLVFGLLHKEWADRNPDWKSHD